MKQTVQKLENRRLSFWQNILRSSRLYGANYDGDKLPAQPWKWPEETWFQRKLQERKEQGPC